jgi:hypothetical protein
MPHRRGLTAARPKISGPLWVTACLAIQCHQPPSWLLPEKFSVALQAKKLETELTFDFGQTQVLLNYHKLHSTPIPSRSVVAAARC